MWREILNLVVMFWLVALFMSWLIGDAKGRGRLGFILGLLFNYYGLYYIIFKIENTKKAKLLGAIWADDPFGRHRVRYWNGKKWTQWVADGHFIKSDPPVYNSDKESIK